MKRFIALALGFFFLNSSLITNEFQDYITSRASARLSGVLFSKLHQDSKNLIFSPMSAYGAMSMAQAGSAGYSDEELQAVLGYFTQPEKHHNSFKRYLTSFENKEGPVSTIFSQAAFIQSDFELREDYKNSLKENFLATLEEVNFKKEPGDAAAVINNWAKHSTKGKIPTIINPEAMPPNLKFLLAQALYFKGKWLNQFNAEHTKPGLFLNADLSKTETLFMHQTEEFRYHKTEDFQLLSLPFRGNKHSLLLILPNEDQTQTTVKMLADNGLTALNKKLRYERVRLYLPKFSIEQNHQLKRPLMAAGVYNSFTPGKADFSKIAGEPGELFLSDVRQQALIELNETGVVAAAVTTIPFATRSALELDEPIELRFDRPFFFVLQDHSLLDKNAAGAILFMGYYGMAEPLPPLRSGD